MSNLERETRKRTTDFSRAKQRLLSDPSMSTDERALLEKVELLVHPNDTMYRGNARHYLSVGLSAIRCIEASLVKSGGNHSIQSILDFPSGYGRVLRFLRVRFPYANISASEIDPDMLNFCRHTFFVNSVKSDTDFNKLSLPSKFDLIWCGSLFTHINETAAIALLKFFYNHLAPNGLCLFTTHGQFSIDSLQNKTVTYGLQINEQNEVISQFHRTGYGYSNYLNHSRYGISAVSHAHMISIADSIGDWKEAFFKERGWDDHQDVYGLVNYSHINRSEMA